MKGEAHKTQSRGRYQRGRESDPNDKSEGQEEEKEQSGQ